MAGLVARLSERLKLIMNTANDLSSALEDLTVSGDKETELEGSQGAESSASSFGSADVGRETRGFSGI